MLRFARIFITKTDVAEEVVQDTWLAVLRGLPAFEGRSSLKTWIFRILANRARTRATREARVVPFAELASADDDGAAEAELERRFTADGHWAEPPVDWQVRSPEALVLRHEAMHHPLLSDQGSATIKAYGLLNTTMAPGTPAYGVPFPGTFMLDRNGRVTARFFEQAYQERTTVSTMLLKSGIGVERPVTSAETAHLRLRAWAGDAALVPGRHVSLVVDVTPLTGMHVYAPGATGYRVVALTLDEVPGVRVLDTIYPPSETYYFAPLKERVPAYMRAFRLTREVLLDPSPQGAAALGVQASITVSGRLDYQACDDKICYNPVSIPLSWSFTVGELDRERARVR